MLDFHQGAARLDVAAAFRQFFPSHCLDDWPVLPNELRRILKVLSLHFDTAGLPACATRYLEIERINPGLRIFPMRLNIPAHAVSPLYCVELGHLRFANLPFVRRECGVGRSDAPPVTQGTPLMRFGVLGGYRHRPARKTNAVQVARIVCCRTSRYCPQR